MAITSDYAVPIIDLESFPEQSKKLIQACEEWGCFRITNHHRILPAPLAAEMKAVTRSLLDLPAEIKRRNTNVIAGSGYMAPSKINPYYEGLGLYDISSSDAVEAFCTQLDASHDQRFFFFFFFFNSLYTKSLLITVIPLHELGFCD